MSPRRAAEGREYVFYIPEDEFGDTALAIEGADLFVGEHDFSAFSRRDPRRKVSGVCTVKRLELVREKGTVALFIAADRFLWNMIRRIAAALVDLSNGSTDMEELEGYLRGVGHYPRTLPPDGLMLWDVRFPAEIEESLLPVAGKKLMSEGRRIMIKERLLGALKGVTRP